MRIKQTIFNMQGRKQLFTMNRGKYNLQRIYRSYKLQEIKLYCSAEWQAHITMIFKPQFNYITFHSIYNLSYIFKDILQFFYDFQLQFLQFFFLHYTQQNFTLFFTFSITKYTIFPKPFLYMLHEDERQKWQWNIMNI